MRYAAAALALVLGACASIPAPVASQAASSQDVQAGPIWNQEDAELKCPVVAFAVSGQWNGQWVTTRPGEMSVCGITGASRLGPLTQAMDIEAGPIWNQQDAELKCPVAATAMDAEWTGQWVTTIWGKMSVCGLRPRAG